MAKILDERLKAHESSMSYCYPLDIVLGHFWFRASPRAKMQFRCIARRSGTHCSSLALAHYRKWLGGRWTRDSCGFVFQDGLTGLA